MVMQQSEGCSATARRERQRLPCSTIANALIGELVTVVTGMLLFETILIATGNRPYPLRARAYFTGESMEG